MNTLQIQTWTLCLQTGQSQTGNPGPVHFPLSVFHSLGSLFPLCLLPGSLVAQTVKHLSTMWGTWVRFLYQDNSLEKKTATHSSPLAQKIPRKEEPGVHGVVKSWTQLSGFTFTFTFVSRLARASGGQWMSMDPEVILPAFKYLFHVIPLGLSACLFVKQKRMIVVMGINIVKHPVNITQVFPK